MATINVEPAIEARINKHADWFATYVYLQDPKFLITIIFYQNSVMKR